MNAEESGGSVEAYEFEAILVDILGEGAEEEDGRDAEESEE